MNRSKLRRQITWEAARLMYNRQESEYYRAKLKAARAVGRQVVLQGLESALGRKPSPIPPRPLEGDRPAHLLPGAFRAVPVKGRAQDVVSFHGQRPRRLERGGVERFGQADDDLLDVPPSSRGVDFMEEEALLHPPPEPQRESPWDEPETAPG